MKIKDTPIIPVHIILEYKMKADMIKVAINGFIEKLTIHFGISFDTYFIASDKEDIKSTNEKPR